MILGTVNTAYEAIVTVVVVGADERELIVDAVIDTGYSSFLTLPLELIEALRLPFQRFGRATLADGSEITYETFEATVTWDGSKRAIEIDAAAIQPLAGMGLLADHEITIHVRPGGAVRIAALEP